MAITVHTQVEGNNRFVYNVRGDYTTSGADETDEVVIDLSSKTGPLGMAPSKLRIDEVWWTINKYDYIKLEFDHTTDYLLDFFYGQGYMDYRPYGGKIDQGTGGTGDLLLTTEGGEAGGSFSFIIAGKFKQ